MFSIKREWVLEREERAVSGAKRNGKRGHLGDCTKVEEEKKDCAVLGSEWKDHHVPGNNGGRW